MKQIRIPEPPTRPREYVAVEMTVDDARELYRILGTTIGLDVGAYNLAYRIRQELRLEGISR